ncbi:hypothetical protein C1H76_8244 [Elsinoe australis]|uniref:DUF4470 domain-containing protein n=1 Tax=Elsinoe australis TaxID=40998 RepID=A0A4U7AWG0_9PEZI|nr:hypothetical protein C1H76_8244 [Elsinoe australis]
MLTISGLNHGTYTFYPLGNTPAVDLLRDTPTSDSQPARLLLLGCGDARNVLFTVAQEVARTKNSQEYTVCDFQPAVLARNIYLFTYLAQHSESIKGGEGARIVSSLWNLYYYHFLISEDDLKVLRTHAKVLVSHSNSLTSWQDSPFGSSIEITNAATLSALHRSWSLYAEGKDFRKHGDFRTQFTSQMQHKYVMNQRARGVLSHNISRSAGIHAAEVMDAIEHCHDHYWTHGVALPTDSVAAGPQKLAVNPALSFSSANANVLAIWRGTNYLAGFHFPTSSETATRQPTSKTAQAITLAAQLEFAGWCKGFASAINAKRIHLIAHCGEALRFAHEIQFLQSKPSALPKTFRIYDRQHSGQVLDICASSRQKLSNPFNVIETSNLSDHIGLLALLPATSALLHPSPTSVLYTETLRAKDDVDDSSLQEMLGVDAVTAAIIFGVIPAGLVNGFMIDVSIPDIGSHEDSYSMRCRFTWRLTTSSQLGTVVGTSSVAEFDPDQLSALLFRWYKLMEPADTTSFVYGGYDLTYQSSKGVKYDTSTYTQASFVALIRNLRIRAATHWTSCISTLVKSIHSYHSQQSLQHCTEELTTLLHLAGLYDSGPLRPNAIPIGRVQQMTESVTTSLPGLVKMALIVPYAVWSSWQERHFMTIVSRPFTLRVYIDDVAEHHYRALDSFFGTLESNKSRTAAKLRSDPKAWAGTSDLIVTCNIRSVTLMSPTNQSFHAAIFPSFGGLDVDVSARQTFMNNRKLFETTIDDEEHVYFLRSSPGADGEQFEVESTFNPAPVVSMEERNDEWKLMVNLNGDGQASGISMTRLLPTTALSRKARPKQAELVVMSPTRVRLCLPGREYHATFPCPVKGVSSETQVNDGKQHLLITATPVSIQRSSESSRMAFPIQASGTQFMPTSLARIALSKQPVVTAATTRESIHSSLRLSKGFTGFNTEAPADMSGLDWISMVVGDIIMSFLETKLLDNAPQPLQVQFVYMGITEVVFHPIAIRYDVHGGGLVLDAIVTTLSNEALSLICGRHDHRMIQILPVSIDVATEQRLTVLKNFIAVCVERSRQGWEHGPKCAYKAKGAAIPLTHEPGENMLCSCGKGY